MQRSQLNPSIALRFSPSNTKAIAWTALPQLVFFTKLVTLFSSFFLVINFFFLTIWGAAPKHHASHRPRTTKGAAPGGSRATNRASLQKPIHEDDCGKPSRWFPFSLLFEYQYWRDQGARNTQPTQPAAEPQATNAIPAAEANDAASENRANNYGAFGMVPSNDHPMGQPPQAGAPDMTRQGRQLPNEPFPLLIDPFEAAKNRGVANMNSDVPQPLTEAQLFKIVW
jgi:hypothetical protein